MFSSWLLDNHRQSSRIFRYNVHEEARAASRLCAHSGIPRTPVNGTSVNVNSLLEGYCRPLYQATLRVAVYLFAFSSQFRQRGCKGKSCTEYSGKADRGVEKTLSFVHPKQIHLVDAALTNCSPKNCKAAIQEPGQEYICTLLTRFAFRTAIGVFTLHTSRSHLSASSKVASR